MGGGGVMEGEREGERENERERESLVRERYGDGRRVNKERQSDIVSEWSE
jgi:hypothetical protein